MNYSILVGSLITNAFQKRFNARVQIHVLLGESVCMQTFILGTTLDLILAIVPGLDS